MSATTQWEVEGEVLKRLLTYSFIHLFMLLVSKIVNLSALRFCSAPR